MVDDVDVETLREDRMGDELILDAETRREDDAAGNEFAHELQAMIEIERRETRREDVGDAKASLRRRLSPRVENGARRRHSRADRSAHGPRARRAIATSS